MIVEQDINILIVDDDLKIADLLKIHLLSIGRIYCRSVSTAEEAVQCLSQEAYDVVISDLRMPGINGMQFLATVNEQFPKCVKVLFTGAGDLSSIHTEMLNIGISHHIGKPWQKTQLNLVVNSIFRDIYSARKLELMDDELNLLKNDRDFLSQKLLECKTGAVTTLRELIQLSSSTIANHCRRTSILVPNLARRLNKEREFVEKVQTASLLHDLPLVTYPGHIHQGLETYMSEMERQSYLKHPEICANLLGNIEDFHTMAEIVRYHHENVDGSGFYGISGDDLPYESKMIRICDCYDEEETYNKNAHHSTLDYMKMFRGKWFDNELFDEFYEMMSSYNKLR